MADTASLKVTKSFAFRGGVREWSNRYHFDGTTPADSGHWTTLSDAVVTAEKAMGAAAPTSTSPASAPAAGDGTRGDGLAEGTSAAPRAHRHEAVDGQPTGVNSLPADHLPQGAGRPRD